MLGVLVVVKISYRHCATLCHYAELLGELAECLGQLAELLGELAKLPGELLANLAEL